MLINITLIIFAYLFCSISFAMVICKLLQLEDPRLHGSKNPGTTNILRLYGKRVAILTLGGDVLKGVIPVIIAKLLDRPDMILASISLASIIGHSFPIFYNFSGGKGIATLTGTLLATHWLLGSIFIAIWLAMAFSFRYSSLSGITAVATIPICTAILIGSHWLTAGHVLIAILIFWRHKSNIKKLFNGEEQKLFTK